MSKRAKKAPARSRAVTRELDRATGKLREDLVKLHTLSAGGSPDQPIALASASQVEPDAELRRCAFCKGALAVKEHEVAEHGGRRLRRAVTICRGCHAEWVFFYSIGTLLS